MTPTNTGTRMAICAKLLASSVLSKQPLPVSQMLDGLIGGLFDCPSCVSMNQLVIDWRVGDQGEGGRVRGQKEREEEEIID